MPIYASHRRTFVCDRCGAEEERRGTEPAPSGWVSLTATALASDAARSYLLCRLCDSKIVRFFHGRDLGA